MISLIFKDLLIVKKTIIICIGYMVLFIFAFQSMGSGGFQAGVVAVAYMLSTTAAAYEEKNKSDIILNSLPVARRDIVLAKYLTIFVYVAIAVVAYSVAIGIVNLLRLPIKYSNINLDGIISAMFSVSVLYGIYFPIFFKVGYLKAKAINFILFFVFFFGVTLLVKEISNENAEWVKTITKLLQNQPSFMIGVYTICITFILLLLSYIASLKFYESREF